MSELTCTDKQWAAYQLNKQGDETYAQYDARICKVVAPPFPVDGNHRLPGSAIEACVALPMMPVDQEFSDKVDEMMAEKTKGTNRRSFKALEEENAELRAEIERLTSPECAAELMNDHIKRCFSKPGVGRGES